MSKVNDHIKVFHHIGRRFFGWAYEHYQQDLNQEAETCKLLYGNLVMRDYSKMCLHHIRTLLRGYGYNRNIKAYDRDIIYQEPETETMNGHEKKILELVQYLFCVRDISALDICYRMDMQYEEKVFNECFGSRGVYEKTKQEYDGKETGLLFYLLKKESEIAGINKQEFILPVKENDRHVYLKPNRRNAKK